MSTRRDFLKTGALVAAGVAVGVTDAFAAIPVSRKGAPVVKLGCAAQSYQKPLRSGEMTLEGFIDLAAELGCDGVELTSYYWPKDFDRAYLNKIRRKCFLLGLDISASSVGNNFVQPAGPKRDESIALTKTWLQHCEEMGAPCMRVFGGSVPKDVSREQCLKWAIEGFEACLPTAEKCGVIMAVENHGGMPATAVEVIQILDGVKSDWVGANLDTGNFHTADPYAEIKATAPYAVTTHYKTVVTPAGGKGGPADVKRIVSILKDAGYRGYLTLEYEGAEDPKTAVPTAIKSMKEALGGVV